MSSRASIAGRSPSMAELRQIAPSCSRTRLAGTAVLPGVVGSRSGTTRMGFGDGVGRIVQRDGRGSRLRNLGPIAVTTCLAACSAPHPLADAIPPAPRLEVVGDDYHGTWVPDPYRWLEDLDAPRTRAWIAAQNRATEVFLSAVPERETLRERLTNLFDYEQHSAPTRYGDRWFYMRNDGLRDHPVLYRSRTPSGPGEVLLDPNTLSPDGSVAVSSVSFTKDGRRLAYALSRSGSDWQEFRVLDAETGKSLADHVRWAKFTRATWLPDGSGFLYSRFPEPKAGEERESANAFASYCLHRIGTDQGEDPVLYSDPEHPRRAAIAEVSDDDRFLVLTITSGTDARNLVSVLDLSELAKPRPSTPHALIDRFVASYRFLGNDGRRCYFLTDRDAPRRRIVRVDLDEPDRWTTIVPETADTLESALMIGDRFVLVYMHQVHSAVVTCNVSGTDQVAVSLPDAGTASGFTGHRDDRVSHFQFESFTRPPSVFSLDPASGRVQLLHAPALTFDPDAFETRQVAFESRDGTRVPMFLVHRKDLVHDGRRPTYLYGYGGFNISLKPTFRPDRIAWLELGGVYAQPSLRGGGEFGRGWHEAGMRESKQNVFDDFLAAARYLVRNDYTCPERLAIGGGSNGGLLVGAALTQQPALFGAAIPEVGVLDMLRYHRFTIGAAWIPEYGSSADPDMFHVLRRYSPLHNVHRGTAYPPTLVMTGDHDDRVLPGHSYKFAAALQWARSGAAPILIRVDTEAGHGAGKPTSKRIAEATDRWAFLVRALAMTSN